MANHKLISKNDLKDFHANLLTIIASTERNLVLLRTQADELGAFLQFTGNGKLSSETTKDLLDFTRQKTAKAPKIGDTLRGPLQKILARVRKPLTRQELLRRIAKAPYGILLPQTTGYDLIGKALYQNRDIIEQVPGGYHLKSLTTRTDEAVAKKARKPRYPVPPTVAKKSTRKARSA